ncbi:LacI family DNA-binding transcriptional regulator [Aquipuribacter nitratireducens]|uniref:LacI family DNA-binding transcriptional regulator n=1 Tax=Aquipuribacter nitratireducens TaxID=650104 RepID=A0ABW0GQI6_9MICO
MASIEDVARATGVSTATVSRALRGLASVAEPTRVRVQKAAQSLGYVPSAAASSLASGRTKAVGLVTPHVSRWFFSVCIETIESVLRTEGYDVLLVILPPGDQLEPGPGAVTPPSRQTIETDLLRKRVDATIVLTLPLVRRELETLRGLGHAVVYVGDLVPGLPSFGIDDVAVGRRATEHLLRLGHRDIALVGSNGEDPDGWGPPRDRYRGYVQAMGAAGLDPLPPVRCDLTVAEGRRAARELLTGGPLPTGVVAVSDEIGIGLLHELRSAGVDVPGRVSVIGVDDHPHADLHGLTTIAQPVAEQAEAAARWLLALLQRVRVTGGRLPAGWDSQQERLPVHLVERRSTAVPASLVNP